MKKKILILMFFIFICLLSLLYLLKIRDQADVPFPNMPNFEWKDEYYVEEEIEERDPISIDEPFNAWDVRINDKIMGLKVYEHYVDEEVTAIRMEGNLTITGTLYTEYIESMDSINLIIKPDAASLEQLPQSIYDKRDNYLIFIENRYDVLEQVRSDLGVSADDEFFSIDNVEITIEDFLFIESHLDPYNRAIIKSWKINKD